MRISNQVCRGVATATLVAATLLAIPGAALAQSSDDSHDSHDSHGGHAETADAAAAMDAATPEDLELDDLDAVRERLTATQAREDELAGAAAEAEQRVADAETAVREAQEKRELADAAHREAAERREEAEARATEARDALAVVTDRLDAALVEYQREDARLRSRAREAYKRSTGGVAESTAAIDALVDEDELDVALNRVELLRKIASRQADEAAALSDLTERIGRIQQLHARQTKAAESAESEAVDAANEAQALLTHSEVLAQREQLTLEAAQDLVTALAEEQDTNAERVVALTEAIAALDEQAANLRTTTTSDSIPSELAVYGNGQVPADALEPIDVGSHRLWKPAADAYKAMVGAAREDGVTIGITDSYRPLAVQVDLVQRKGLYSQGGLAARPGTSNHGWGLAVDLILDAEALAWMRTHADDYGFIEDTPREPWHWGFHDRPDQG